MRFVLYSQWFPVCVGVFLARAARRANLDFVTCGPTSGSRMPWPDVEGVRYEPFVPDCTTVDEALLRDPDLWVDVDGGLFVDRKLPCRRVLVATDPHVEEQSGAHWSYRRQRELVGDPASVFVMQSPYCLPGEKWLPYAFDPGYFWPMERVKEDYDVTVLGAPYPERRKIAFALRGRGLRVLGPGFGGIGVGHCRDLCRAPVAVVWPLSDDLPCRVFEARASGRCVLTRNVPDLAKSGMSTFCFSLRDFDVGRLADFAESLVEPARGAEHDVAPPPGVLSHTWDARLAQLLAGTGLA